MAVKEQPEDDAERSESASRQTRLVRLVKPVVKLENEARPIDTTIIAPKFYNAFNYSVLSRDRSVVNLTVGVTSANRGDGKTLVASNLAVSLATANERDTVIVDLNVAEPAIHRIFGVDLAPGLAEAIIGPNIAVARTRIPHLSVLTAGADMVGPILASGGLSEAIHKHGPISPTLGLEHVAEFRNVLYSLREVFEFVIVDMPSMKEPEVPVLLSHQVDGVLVVVSANQTTREEVDRMVHRIHDERVLGFVLNGVDDEEGS